ncbi:ABC transporter permease [Aciditerrimonas ferrireducens]|uniref:ABC transporter permease n=1 Tax=Aciditerrimonas ferrireducens TaxID=667306 RepID=UPI0020032976|nr:ABC transporter permease subunit [Aciditerrimonas ferrireducens]MCK4176893.1 ABC transporter permease subunit [Aciditerrimonas ferrireducens]
MALGLRPAGPTGEVDERPADEPGSALERSGSRGVLARRILRLPLTGLLPLFAYLTLFFVVPTVGVLVQAFQGPGGRPSLANLRAATTGVYLHALVVSVELSTVSAVVAAVLGTLAVVALTGKRGGPLSRLAAGLAAVLANTGGIPLAFAFIATLGNFGVVTGLLGHLGLDPYRHGFTLYSVTGLVVVYQYFLIPMMVLVMLPAVEGLRREWREAAESLGATGPRYWRHVGLPLLAPTFLSGLLVLFADAFAAYATAAALAGGVIPLVPLDIGNLVSGNVVANQANLGDALGVEMVVLVVLVASCYSLVVRRRARWLR